jgi:hypothetical protein
MGEVGSALATLIGDGRVPLFSIRRYYPSFSQSAQPGYARGQQMEGRLAGKKKMVRWFRGGIYCAVDEEPKSTLWWEQ